MSNFSQVLAGATRRSMFDRKPGKNPDWHSAPAMESFGAIERWTPDDSGQYVLAERHDWHENIACTQGLTTLAKLVATGGEASGWISAAAIGTGTTAANSTQSDLIASTAIVHRSQASMVGSDAGNMTAQFNLTFASNNPAGAAAITEIGLFGTNAATNRMVARTVLGASSVNKGASDVINASYAIVFKTAA